MSLKYEPASEPLHISVKLQVQTGKLAFLLESANGNCHTAGLTNENYYTIGLTDENYYTIGLTNESYYTRGLAHDI